MRIRSVITVVTTVLTLFLVGCKDDDVFRMDLTKSLKAEVKRNMEMTATLKMNVAVDANEMKLTTIKSSNSLSIVADSVEKIKDKKSPGVFSSSETLRSAEFKITQKQTDSELSASLKLENGEVKILGEAKEKKSDGQNAFEEAAKKTLEKMATSSGVETEVTVDARGKITNISSSAPSSGSAEPFHLDSGFKDIIFPEKAVKVGDTWSEKKDMTSLGGFRINDSPIEYKIKYSREKDEVLNGKKVAVFKSSNLVDKKGVKGIFAGYNVKVNLKSSKEVVLYFDKSRKIFVKSVLDLKNELVTFSDAKKEDERPANLMIDIKNNVHSISTEKVD